jgi:pimeloyl-ACP methyl ester carboxylesterase
VSDVVLIHAGVADARMWEPQLRSFAPPHRVVAPDLPGFGRTPLGTDVVDNRAFIRSVLDAQGMERAALVGTSLGARVAVELALESPERVSALVLVGPGLDGHEWSEQVQAFGAEEEQALERGDLEGAIEANLRLWLAGPRRSLDAIDPDIRDRVAAMQRRAFELQKNSNARMALLEPPASSRLADVRAPTLVLTGDEDVPDIHEIADKLAAEIPGAERATIADAAHLPNLERPREFDRIVLAFLAEHGV